jgi:hypothetical protein
VYSSTLKECLVSKQYEKGFISDQQFAQHKETILPGGGMVLGVGVAADMY